MRSKLRWQGSRLSSACFYFATFPMGGKGMAVVGWEGIGSLGMTGEQAVLL